MRRLYLDYNATTPLDPRVFEAMRPFFLEEMGNAGSRTHVYGQRARVAVEQARQQVTELLGARSDELIFTSGATESNNLVLRGLVRHGLTTGRKHVLATSVEHKSVLEPLDCLRQSGFEVELVPVTAGGYVEASAVQNRLRADTLLVSVMHANNETGVLAAGAGDRGIACRHEGALSRRCGANIWEGSGNSASAILRFFVDQRPQDLWSQRNRSALCSTRAGPEKSPDADPLGRRARNGLAARYVARTIGGRPGHLC